MIKKLLKKYQLAGQSRFASRYYDFIASMSSLSPQLIREFPKNRNVMILAPHCDDEAAGCGGAIYKHQSAGNLVTVVFLTDGSQCKHNGTREEIIALRRQEARAAGKILGVSRFIFLDNVDRQLRKTDATVNQVLKILSEVKPDTVYLPFMLDNHPDHRETARIFAAASKQHPVDTVFFYEIWSALIPSHLLDISDAIDAKMEAMHVYRSQTAIVHLAEQIKSLNRFRSLNSDNLYRYAEGFFKIDPEHLYTLSDRLNR